MHSSHWVKGILVQRYTCTNPRRSQIARVNLFQPIERELKASALFKWAAK